MRLRTHQPLEVLVALERDGSVLVDPDRVNHGREGVPFAYRWLSRRVAGEGTGGNPRLPWWLYTFHPGHEICPGSALLTLEVPREQVFAMPSWAWNQVFHGSYLPRSSAGWMDFQRHVRRVRRRTGRCWEEASVLWSNPEAFVREAEGSLPAQLDELRARRDRHRGVGAPGARADADRRQTRADRLDL